MLAHLEREDKHLYPVLLRVAEEDPIVRDALDFFYEDMAGVASAAIAFFDKYEAGGETASFAADFSELVNVLTQRIEKEESIIYKMYSEFSDT